MSPKRFHSQPFDEGTRTKLDIFELYAREWLPVFLANRRPRWSQVHVFDFFAGPGTDSQGEPGSPLRLLRQMAGAQHLAGWSSAQVHLHLFDSDPAKISALQDVLASRKA